MEHIDNLQRELEQEGHAVLRGLLSESLCAELATAVPAGLALPADPLPEQLQQLHVALRGTLAKLAKPWQALLGTDPEELCPVAHAPAGTGTLLHLGVGEFRPLAHSIKNAPRFPLQASILLSRRQADFEGGDMVLVEQRPRMQSKPIVVDLQAGDLAIFPARYRPVQGLRGLYRVTTRHAVTRIIAGRRVSADLLFEP
jgi:hypothetical protein